MEISTILTLMGVCVAIVSGVATIITIVVGGYALYIQNVLAKRSKQEFQESFNKMLDEVSKDPLILEKFMDSIVQRHEFKNRFLELIHVEIENILQNKDDFQDLHIKEMCDINQNIKRKFQLKGKSDET